MADLPILDELRHELREAGRRTAPAPRRRSWRPAFAVAAAGLAAAFVVVVGPAGTDDELASSQDPVGPVLVHAVYETASPHVGRSTSSSRVEQWTTPDFCEGRAVTERPPGKVWGEQVQSKTEIRVWNRSREEVVVSAADPAMVLGLVDPFTAARDTLRRGRSRIIGRTEVGGRAMVWREVSESRGLQLRYLTDAKSLETFEIRMIRRDRLVHRVRLVTREEVPYDAALLKMAPHPEAKVQRLKQLTLQVGGRHRCG